MKTKSNREFVESVYEAGRDVHPGKSLVELVAHAWDLKDGKVIRLHQYVDTASIRNKWKPKEMIQAFALSQEFKL